MKNAEKLSGGLLIYGYAIALGIAYIFSFWRPIGFNIFSYLTPTDILLSPLNRLLGISITIFLVLIINTELENKKIKLPFYGFLSLIVIIYIYFAKEFVKSISLFMKFDFFFLNEKSILYFCGLFIFISVALTIRSFINRTDKLSQVLAVALAHIALSMSAGYSDGKTIFNGAENVHFLEQKELCEKGGVRDWVYLEKFGGNVFFLNTIEKRICILNEIKFNLSSRKYKEGL